MLPSTRVPLTSFLTTLTRHSCNLRCIVLRWHSVNFPAQAPSGLSSNSVLPVCGASSSQHSVSFETSVKGSARVHQWRGFDGAGYAEDPQCPPAWRRRGPAKKRLNRCFCLLRNELFCANKPAVLASLIYRHKALNFTFLLLPCLRFVLKYCASFLSIR